MDDKPNTDIKKSGEFSEQVPNSTQDTPKQTPQGVKDAAPQSILDSISDAAVHEDSDNEKKKRILIPKITIDSFYDKKHLKRKVKILLGIYCLVIFGGLIYGLYGKWSESRTLTTQWEQREKNYIEALTSVNLSEYNTSSKEINAGLQTDLDPVLPMYMLEQIANETSVTLVNPGYSFNSNAVNADMGIVLSFQITGLSDRIELFVERIEAVKPIIQVTDFTSNSLGGQRYQANIVVEFLYTTNIDESIDEIDEKFVAGTQVEYPIRGIAAILTQLEELQLIVMEKIGTFELGKSDLFSS